MSIQLKALKNGRTGVTLYKGTDRQSSFTLPGVITTLDELEAASAGVKGNIRVKGAKVDHLGIVEMKPSADGDKVSLPQLVKAAVQEVERKTRELVEGTIPETEVKGKREKQTA